MGMAGEGESGDTRGRILSLYECETPAQTRAKYEEWARIYEDDMAKSEYVSAAVAAEIFARHCADRAARVLDAGCGTGLSGLALAQEGFSAIDGADLSPEMLRRAEQKNIYRKLAEADILAGLPFADGEYAGAMSAGMFTGGHVGPEGVGELARVVCAGGFLVFSVNELFYEKMEYPKTFARLQSEGKAKLLSAEKKPYLAGVGIAAYYVVLESA